jgi:hypothetical protein
VVKATVTSLWQKALSGVGRFESSRAQAQTVTAVPRPGPFVGDRSQVAGGGKIVGVHKVFLTPVT